MEKLKKWWEELKKKLNITIEKDKEVEVETALKALADELEKDRTEEKKDGNPIDPMDEFSKKIKEILNLKEKKDEQPASSANQINPDSFIKGIQEVIKPLADSILDLKKQNEEFIKQRDEQKKEAAAQENKRILEEAYKKGKFSSAEISFYRDMLEKNQEVAKSIIEKLPDNAVVSKMNSRTAFTLDGKPKEEMKPMSEEEKKKSIAKKYNTTWAGSIAPDILEHVESENSN